jgi:hypothetical protein
MNATERKIEIFKPFGEAFELMTTILFRPFDLKKWFTIGFAAFLANLGRGGPLNFGSHDINPTNPAKRAEWQSLLDRLHQLPSETWIIVIAIGATVLVAMIVVFAWLRARGAFLFVDCVVKNRGVIAEPWREFSRQGNSLFLFSLAVGIGMTMLLGLLALPFMLPIVRGVARFHLHDVYLISMIVLWGTVFFVLILGWTLISQIMVPVMYRRKCRAMEGFRAACALIADYPGEIVIYCLFWFVLGLAVVMVSCLVTCATCCLAAVPYVGTVILLPIFVFLRAFTLLFVRQFGEGYDAWPAMPPPPELSSLPPEQQPA